MGDGIKLRDPLWYRPRNEQHWWNMDWTEAQLEILWILKQALGGLNSLQIYMKRELRERF